ncbi:hypothetical protein HY029_04500 [Candidatus Gottesmanbacteria bacterium]|nr:hypothetical protein [Candidatus Gottesmanbacteria bacterium]
MFSKKHFIGGTLIGAVLLFAYIFSIPDGKLHITFCNVGQGDAAYIRTPSNQDMLIDGGPDDKVLTCLGKHMPFYDRTIDIVLLTHPQKDHMQGLISVIQRYNVKYFVIGVEGNETSGYKLLVDEIKKKNVTIKNLYRGDKFSFGKVEFDLLWPDKQWLVENGALKGDIADIGSKQILGLQTSRDLNDFSYYVDLKYGSFSTLFTGDGDSKIQPDIIAMNEVPQVTVLKFPHHGSKTGILPEFLDKIKPKLAVISVGKNSYGHPTKEALQLLESRSIELKRTDLSGDVEVVSDGQKWIVN